MMLAVVGTGIMDGNVRNCLIIFGFFRMKVVVVDCGAVVALDKYN